MNRRMIDQEAFDIASNKTSRIDFGKDSVSSTTPYRLLKTEFVAGTADNNSKIVYTLEKYIAAQAAYCTVSGPLTDVTTGTVLFTGVEANNEWDMWVGYTGSTACEAGQCVKGESESITYICNIGGTKKYMSYEGTPGKFTGTKIAKNPDVSTEYGTIEYTAAVPEGITTIQRKQVLTQGNEDEE